MRIKFQKGNQRKFLELVLERTSCPSLRSLISRGFNIQYSTLKSYFSENRTLPEDLFDSLCIFSGLKKQDFSFEVFEDNWGKVLGGNH